MDDTIAAIATALGESSIGVVRVSGAQAVSIVAKIFRPAGGKPLEKAPTHTVHYGWIAHPADRSEVDEVLVTVMRAPRTYTREDVVEISGHGGRVGVRRILELIVASGARLAAPGEFTKRAFLNGRIDLTQAEAVLQLVRSTHDAAQASGLKQLKGGLSATLENLRQKLLGLQAPLEVSVDFPGENHDIQSTASMAQEMRNIQQQLEELIRSGKQGRMMWEGYAAVICGRPNVGKSSLLNAILKRDRAIVTPIPGTTRDTVEEVVVMAGIPVRLVDTAGWMESGGWVEALGVRRTQEAIAACDMALWVMDGSEALTAEDGKVAQLLGGKPVLIVLNKSDLPQRVAFRDAQAFFPQARVAPVSASRGLGIEKLQQEIIRFFQADQQPESDLPQVTLARHLNALTVAHEAVVRAGQAAQQEASPELIAMDVKEALDHLGLVTGQTADDELLETIFSQFCIGK
ncbi:MAG: tRNA uridine-5-carboxymethylaminomethyl(34) synthesis GTPase MnmE [Candidatus Omnitrophica bacterium]|nr:tRNA uridine-5-carboxymethylaminomethyl(34) synthesis GTPase MnmE [Candidatus Omnitrophota bacterium]